MTSSKHNKNPQIYKTPEEIEKEAKRKQEVERKRIIIVDKFYPALVAATISIDEAEVLVQTIATLLMEDTLRTMRERKFADIKESLLSILCKDGERTKEIEKLLEVFNEENLFTARELIEGMTRAIKAMTTEEMRERKLDTLKTNWEKHLVPINK